MTQERCVHLHNWWTCTHKPINELQAFSKSEFRPKRLQKPTYLKALDHLLANLLYADKVNAYVVYSRDNTNSPVIKTLIEWMISAGMVEHQKGQRNQYKKQASRVWLSEVKRLEMKKRRVSFMLANDEPFITLRDSEKNTLPLPNKPRIIKQLNEPCRAMNRLWLEQEACFSDGRPVDPFLMRVFNEDLDHGGRFYFGSQTEPSENRKGILINGEPTVELDYKAIHFNLLYAEAGIQFAGDPYLTDSYDRTVIKLAMLSFLNCENRGAWCANITRSGNPANASMKGFIDGIPAGTKGLELAKAIDERHAPIADKFHTKDIGITLQNKDSQIMSQCLLECANLNIPVLPYHDGIRCPESALGSVYQIMKDAYKQVMKGFDIEVEIE